MATEGFVGYYVETRNYGATAAFWASMGFKNVFETDHRSGQWQHPAGGPYVFINEQQENDLGTHPVLRVADSTAIEPSRPADRLQPGVMLVRPIGHVEIGHAAITGARNRGPKCPRPRPASGAVRLTPCGVSSSR